jgi:glycosyltransferase involved in cell wall biosynthesis
MSKNYKISFCTTCKGRLEHLKQTLPLNLKNNEGYPNTEFVILNYDSNDGLEEWIKENFQKELASGKIRYARYTPAEHFKMAHAKNMAHRLATGDVVCNLDADNITGPGFAGWLNEQFSKNPEIYISPRNHALQRMLKMVTGIQPTEAALSGRIAMTKRNFDAIRGYDEQRFNGYGREDTTLAMQASHLHTLSHVIVPREIIGSAIEHSDKKRIENMEPVHQDDFLNKRALGRHEVAGVPVGRFKKFVDCVAWMPEYRHRANRKGEFGAPEAGATLCDINGQPLTLPPVTVTGRSGAFRA